MATQWTALRKLLERGGPLAHPEFVPSPENLDLIRQCKVLVIGAGGLGCELLKGLALSGFSNIHVIDMDTVELSNLNRQFLFREKDVGLPKAVVAAEAISKRIPGCSVVPHFCRIEDKGTAFYADFDVVVAGLDSVSARRWINRVLFRLLNYNADGSLDRSTVIPLVDGGVEGFKGNVRVVLPGLTACVECHLDLYPPPVNYPMCTISSTPRSAEHCIEYVRVVLWPAESPFDGAALDGDNPTHIKWIYEKAMSRAKVFGIDGVTYRLTKGVVKNIIPAVASTNALVAAACALEVFKLASNCSPIINNYTSVQNADSIYMNTLELEKREDCPLCSNVPIYVKLLQDSRLSDLRDYLMSIPKYRLTDPSFAVVHPMSRMLYVPNKVGEEQELRENLNKTLQELGLENEDELYVGDPSLQSSVLTIRLRIVPKSDSPAAMS